MERRLAAILCADVVGYTRLMGGDEAGTLRRLTELREAILEPLIAGHRGRVVKLMGDGVMVEFSSVVDAISCAVDWQKQVAVAEAAGDEETRLRFRIGVNLGEVIVEDDDIHGQGVNIAARLEGLAEPGGICLSDDAYRQVRGRIEVAFEDLGRRRLKNISDPVGVYRVAADGTADDGRPPTTAPLALPDKPSIAVLPFDNMSGDGEQEYFSDGITEDIITALARFRSLFVVARNSSFTYKGQAVDVAEVGRTLGVEYVVEGSVRKAGNRVRVTAQLVEAESGNHIWADRYDRELEDIFAVQDEVVERIVSVLPGRLEGAGADRLRRKPTESLSAYDCVLHGNRLVARMASYDDNREARTFYRRATELDPTYAQAFARLSTASFDAVNVWSEGDTARRDALTFGRRAVELDDDDSWSHAALGLGLFLDGKDREAEIHMQRAVSINPNDADLAAFMAMMLICFGRHEEAIEWSATAMRLNPYSPDWYRGTLAEAAYLSGDYGRTIDTLMQMTVFDLWDRRTLAAAYGQLGDPDRAKTEWATFLSAWQAKRDAGEAVPDDPLVYAQEPDLYRRQSDRERWLDGMRKAGLTA